MGLYCLVVGSVLLLGGIALLMFRIRFVFSAICLPAIVVEKVFRNTSAENSSSRGKFLKLRYKAGDGSFKEYVCDTNILTPFYTVGDGIILAVKGDKVLGNSD
ncbi:hypothetical protein [Sessilibacter sp. MAH4]